MRGWAVFHRNSIDSSQLDLHSFASTYIESDISSLKIVVININILGCVIYFATPNIQASYLTIYPTDVLSCLSLAHVFV